MSNYYLTWIIVSRIRRLRTNPVMFVLLQLEFVDK
jgi:hypothetical protein